MWRVEFIDLYKIMNHIWKNKMVMLHLNYLV